MPAMGIEGIGDGSDEFDETGEPLPDQEAIYGDLGDHYENIAYAEDPAGQPSAETLDDAALDDETADGEDPDELPVAPTVVGPPEAADVSATRHRETDEVPEALEGQGDSAAGTFESSFEPEAAARRTFQELDDLLTKINEVLADAVSIREAMADRPGEVQEEADADETMRFQFEVLRQAIELFGQGGASQSAKQSSFLTLQAQACLDAVEENKRNFPQNEIWKNRFFQRLTAKLPWLVPAVAALTEVREWSAGGTLGVPGLAQGSFSVTFGRPSDK